MPEGKNVYPIELQRRIVKEAIDIINTRYGEDPSVLAIYLGGSAVDGTFGEYKRSVEHGTEPRMYSDIDVMLVIPDRYGPTILPREEQERYGIRHIGKTEEIPLYRLIDEKGDDLLLHDRHTIEPMIVTKGLFEGWLSNKYKWGNEQSRPFPELVKDFRIIKETEELKKIREKYD